MAAKPMTLAEKVASDFEAGRAALIHELHEQSAERKKAETRRKLQRLAYADIWTCHTVWIPLLESTPECPTCQRVAAEMRRVHRKVREILNG